MGLKVLSIMGGIFFFLSFSPFFSSFIPCPFVLPLLFRLRFRRGVRGQDPEVFLLRRAKCFFRLTISSTNREGKFHLFRISVRRIRQKSKNHFLYTKGWRFFLSVLFKKNTIRVYKKLNGTVIQSSSCILVFIGVKWS